MFISKHECNHWNTTDLVRCVMATVARRLDLNINDDSVSDRLYDICCDLESFPEGEGFGSSDHFSYVEQARKEFAIADAT